MLRIVLPDATSRDDLDDTAAALGLLLVNIVPRTESYPAQVIYMTPDMQALVHLVDDGGSPGKPGSAPKPPVDDGAKAQFSWVVRADGGDAIEQRWAGALRGEVAS